MQSLRRLSQDRAVVGAGPCQRPRAEVDPPGVPLAAPLDPRAGELRGAAEVFTEAGEARPAAAPVDPTEELEVEVHVLDRGFVEQVSVGLHEGRSKASVTSPRTWRAIGRSSGAAIHFPASTYHTSSRPACIRRLPIGMRFVMVAPALAWTLEDPEI